MNTSVSGSFKKSPEVAIASDQAFKEKDYWMEKLAGEWVPGSFPYDNRDKVYRERRLETLELIFADELFSRLMIISKGSDPKLHMILVAGLAVLLYKYTVTGNRDIVICTSIDKQGTGKEFINTILPLRIQQDKDMTFKQLLLLVMETINEALENQNYPIEVLIYDDLGITAENESSLMDVALILENIQDKKYIEHIGCSMVFSFLRTNKCIEGIIEYDSCRYMRTTIERIASHFIYLLRQAVFNVDLRLTGIDLLSENERKQILFDFNKNRAEFPLTKTIDHFIRERARKTPDHVAAEHKGKHLTYTQFNKRSGQLAHRLRGCGIAADERVGIIIERSPLLLEVILGIWKAGGSYIPIEIQYPKMRMVEILKDSAAKVLLAESRFLVPGLETLYQGEIIDPDLLLNQTAGPGTGQNANSEIEINMTSMAYVIYTSGSTGRPKGVMVEHIGMMNHIHAKINDLQLTAKSIVAQNSSYTFDISIWQFFAALTRGGKTIIYPYTLIIEPTQFIQRIIQDQLTVLEVVPSYLSVLLDALELNPGKINSLEYLLVTGEEVKHRLIEQWLEKFPHIKMVNAYGPTEASDDITHYIMDHVPDIKPIPIGQPLQNMDIYIVDENMKLCPLGLKGEICVSGIGVGRGYLNDQNKTAQAFIRGPFPEGNQERNLRLYKTGDLGTWLPDGNIRFFGRKDHQVKIRGYRIELGEIEWNLMEHQSIKEAVVIDRKNPKGIQSLCAYLVPRERLDMAEIKEYLLNRLPDYMVPDYFIELDRVPLTSNGKIDRKALSEIEIHMPSALPFISGEMLKNAIHSTSAREKTSHRLSGEETERLFNKLREALEHEHFTLQECREQAGNNRTYYPLSYPQRMMYYIEKRNPGTGCNNVVYTVKYPEETDGEMLEQAINHVLYKNEALRLRIIEIEHESSPRFVQYVSDYKSQCIDRLDFSGKNAKMSQEKWLETDARKGFDLLDNDLFYFAYIKFNEKTSGYYVKLHHIICDAVSIHFIFKEINKIYQDIKSGKTIDNKPNPSYLQYIAREQAYLKSSRVKEDMEFWLNYILPPPEEVHLSPRRGETGNPRANISKLLFPRTLNQKIYEYCKNNKTTPYRLILAALSIYISRACAVKDIVIGTLNNNRSLFQYIKMFGIFIGFVPLRIHVQGNIGFNDFIKRIGRDINRIINNHQEFPFEILAAQLGESIGFDHRYFSNINLISHPDLELKDFAIERHFSGFDTAPLSIYINRANKGIHGLLELDWVFRVDQFLETEIEQIHYRLANILADALANPVKKVAEIELVSMQEKEHILDKFSRAGSLPKIDIPLELSDNHVIYILDETGMMQPVGIPGELAVGPEASRGKEEEIYPTGELARWLPNGNIEQLGRIEYQVRIKGIRIDLQKIENHLLSFSGVEEAVVVKKYNRAVPYLCAFIALKKNLTESELKEYMSSRFSPYMIPKHFVQLEKMPLTGDGSLDRELLERIDIKPDMEMEHLRPRNETEEKLAEIWADVLGVEKNEIGINSSFFELGGHSLNATILASKIHREFNVKISLAEIFRAPDIVRLSEYINGLAEEKYESIQPAEKKEYYELSSAQKRLYILQQMELNSSAYNLPRITVLEGELDKKTWEETLKNLLKRHESLMTSFHMVDDEPVQKIHDHAEFKVRYFDLKIAQVEVKDGDEEGTRGLAPLPGEHATRNPQSATALISSFIRPFDLSQAPLLRVGLIKIREKKHLLMLDMHHIISDALSHPILINDFGDVYAGKDLPPLRLHYKDFSQWQNHHKQKEILTQQKEYWLKTFADDIPVLNLPLDYARPGYQNFEGSTLGFELGTGETQALNQLAMKENTTLYVVLLAIFHLLLSKISGQEKHVIGSPIIGRKHADLEKIVGIFLNTLALKNQVEDNRSFIHLLQQVEENTLAAFENQDYPFEELVEQLPLERDVSRNPLFDVMFSWLKRDYTSNIDIPGVKLMPYEYEIRISKFDLELYAVEAEGKLLFTFEYCTKLFKQETIERFIYYFKKIISSILIAPGIKILDIEIISEEEKKQILFDFNDTDAEYPQDKTIHELVAEQLERTSDKIAVIGHGGTDLLVSVSYRELNQRANRLARVLNSRGIQRDDPVGIVMERSQQMVESIMAIWKAGGAYIPIDPGYPHERIDHMLSDSQAKVLVTRQDLSKDIKFEKEIIYLSEPINRVPTTSHLHLSPVSPAPVTSLAYIIYTSGSTGKPRGVMIEHIGMMNHIQAKINDLRLTENSIVAQNAAHTFDISVWQFFAALILGGKTIIYPDELIMDPRKFLIQLVRDEVTILEVVPSYLSVLLDETAEQSTFPLSLHYLLVTGEEIKPHLVRKWFDQYPGIKMVNAYGPTEASDDITHYIMDKAPDMERIPIGKPLQNMNIYIVDKRMQLCPIGVKGEICVSGVGVGRGYIGDKAKTKQVFIKNPFFPAVTNENSSSFTFTNDCSPQLSPNNRLYKTGDMGTWLPDGTIEFFGRKDYQVKIRGFRIELGEIENRLLNHPEIKEAVVIDREDQVGNKFLCAYVVPDSSNLPEFVKIKEFLSEGLPDYMLPLHYIPLDKIPLTPNGKVDRKHLPGPELIDLRNSAAYIVPGNIIEKKLVETWQEVLGKAPVSINDNFFEIGGDSIKTIQIISRMRKAGYKLEMRDIFQNPQISALAPIVKKIERKADQSVITGTVPLTPIQKDFFENQLTDKHHYNQAVMLMLEEGFDQEAVKTIFTKIQEHHDALRMTYKEEKGKIIQTNHGLEYPLSLNVYDLRNQEYAGTILEQKANELQSSINLETGPLMKLGLFHLQDGHRLLIAIHHLVIDGISWRILFEDMAELYQQYKREEKLVLPLKADSFKVWAEKLKDYANSDLFLKEKTYWAQLESELIPVIRKDFETEDNYIKDVGKLSFTLNGEETHLLLTRVNEAFGTEINDILLTALGLAVKRVYGNDRLLIALEGHGREEILGDIDVSRTVGWFTSLYPLLLDFSYESADADDSNLSRQIKEVKEMLRQMPHKGVGYGILKYLTSETHKKEINFRLNPQIIFNYLGQFDEDLEHPSFKIAPESTGDTRKKNQQREFEVEVSGMITGKRLVMSITYNSTQYEAETIEELLAHFKNALSQIISYCSGRDLRELTPSDFTYSLLSIEALEQLQEQFSYKIEDIYTLSPLQEGMLFHSLYDRHSLAYFEQISYRLKGELDEVVFKKSLKKLIRRYDILRTVFVHEELECPLQIVLKYPRLDFIFEDVRKIAVLGGNRLEKFIEEFKEKDKRRTFDLSKDALMRVSVIRVDEKEYELIWSFHHILIDGWCLGILIAEYFEFYNSFLENRPPKLSPVKPYRTYIKWLEKHDKEESKEYWRAYLDTYEQLTTIPRLRVSNAGDGSEGEVAYQLRHMVLSLDEEKTDHLNKLAGRNNVTLNTIMQAMWGVILGRYNGKQDVVFGSVVSGRPSDIEGVESMVGLFLNTIPVRIRYEGETTFNQLLRVVQRDALESEKHHHYPLAEIQSEHRLKQSLLDHIFVFENYPLAEQIDGMNVENNKSNFQISNTQVFEQTNYNLHINVSSGTSLRAIFCFNALVYEEPLMHTVLQHFKDLVRQIIENPGIEVRAIEKITAEQKQETLLQLNRELPEEAAKFEEENHAIQERLTKNFAKYSANIAIEQGNKKVTYGELDEKSNFIAHCIVNMGLPKETFIGVLINDKVDLIITMIGILKAGCVFIPLDSAHPLDRVKIMVDSTDTKVVISDGINFNQFAPGIMGNSNEKKVKLFLIEELFSPGHAPWYGMPPKIEYCPEDKIYIYFTSGTTGHPKAIVGKNKGLFHFIDWEIETMQVDETFRISQFTTPGFDAFLRDILLPLCTGGVICIPERKETLMAAHQLVGWIERTGINLIHCVPALFRSINSISLTENNFVTLKYILLSGEKSEPVDFVYWFEIFNDRIKLVNLWGTSETTLAKTCYFVRPSDVNRVRMPVGHPINGCRVVVLDENLRLCDELITGELYIATPFRSFGYYNDPRMNQDRFIKNPFNTNPDDVLHKTGDLGRLLPGGNIDVLGRNDRQVKIRGIRIELEGIENVLVRHPWVNEAVVIKKEKSDNNEFLCAYVTGKETNPTEDADVVIPDLKQYLSGLLPDYMIPANIQKMKEIPRTPNGKVDYKKLPDPFEYKKTGIIGPNNSIEEKILDYWSEILGIEKNKIGITNLFFELGGNSLNIMSLISKIHREFSIRISLAEIFNNPTIEMQAKIIKGAAGENKYASIEKTELKEYYALSPAQNRLYILHQMEPDSVAYNMPQMVVLEGKLAKDRLEQSFWKLIKRHQSLRSSFKMINDEPVQKIHVEVELKSEYYQSLGKEEERSLIICEQSQVDVEVKVNEIINNFIRPFDLSHAPLLRVGLINTPRPKGHPSQEGNYNNRHILMFDLHHIISDGVSHSILIKDFMALYKREETSPLRIHYKDFSEWRNKEDQKNALEEQKKYWLREFEGEIPVLNIHTDYPRPSVQSFEGNRINFEIDEEKTKALNNLAAAQGTTLYTVLLAAFNLLLAKISGQEDIVIGTPVAGRRHADLEEIIGMFVNTLALRSYPKGEGIFINFLQHVKKNTLEAFENQEYPFEDIVEHVAVNRDVSRNPLFDVMLVLQNMDFPKVKIPGLELFPYQYKKRISKFDLTLHSTEAGEKLLLAFEYCTKLFKKETIERFIAYFRKIVTSILIEPRIKISDIEIIPGQEKKKILLDFNDTDAEYPQNKTIHELFAEQVKRTPDHIALVGQSEDERSALCAMRCALTYKELNEISNHLAHLLQTKNVKPDTIVGIMVERSIEMIIGILGILKAGGAYLPIDPEYPEERINYMSADSRAKFLVTTPDLVEKYRKLSIVNCQLLMVNEEFPDHSINNYQFTIHNSQLNSSRLAYVIYTSGSTGKPKGVMVEHRSVVNRLNWMQRMYPIEPRDVILQKTTFTFDVSVWELFWWSFQGASVCLLGHGDEKSPGAIIEAIEIDKVTTIHFVPSMLNPFLEYLENLENSNGLSTLRHVFASGEALSVHHVETFNRLLKQRNEVKLINLYGPTEATVDVSYFNCPVGKKVDNIPIGKPIDNIRLYIVDRWHHLQPVDVSGELCIAGLGLARGYLNNPELTKEKFQIPNPITPMPHYPIYMTGDLARWLPDGNIEFIGRIDHQVKIRGFRIELGEIECHLLNDNEIKEAVVAAEEDKNGTICLCAYIVSGKDFTVSHLRSYLAGRLPDYMLPSFFIPVDKIPLTASGKVDRKRLPEPQSMDLRSGGAYIAPRSLIEKKLTQIWQKVLGIRTVSINDNFFEIGGDSIKTIQIISQIRKVGYKLEMSDIFRYPRISDLTTFVKKVERIADQSVITGTVPLTPIQKRFFENQIIDNHHYNQAVMFVLEEGFDQEAVKAVFTKIQAHHDALRMTYRENNGEIIQVNRGLEHPLSLQVFDYRNREDARSLLEGKANEIQASINLETGPLMRLGLFHLDDGHRLLIVTHHLVIDGVSWRILFEDIETLYRQYKKDKPLTLPLKTDAFKLWSEKLSDYANSDLFLKEKMYWAELESKQIQKIKKDFEEEDNYMKDVESLSFSLQEIETHLLLTKVNEAFGTEINDILLTALGFAVKKICGNDRLLIALEGHGREEILNDVDVSRTMGWFTTLYPIILDFSHGEKELSLQIKEVKENLRKLLNKGIGYGILKYLTRKEHKEEIDFRLNPQVIFNYLGQFDEDLGHRSFRIAKESVGYTHSQNEKRGVDLEVSGIITNKRLIMSVSYNRKQYKQETITELLEYFKRELVHIITYCSSRQEKELTPSDLTYPELSIKTLDQLQRQYSHLIEDIYTLTPMQEGMLFYALFENEARATYFEQMSYRLQGGLNVPLVEKSLNELFKRHDVLRTVFIYEGLNRPIQVVLKERNVDFYFEDLRESLPTPEKKEIFIREFLDKDRQQSFDLSKDVLMRVAVIQLADAEYQVTWSSHHILMDGWCIGILISEFFQVYTGYLETRTFQLPAIKPYRTYIQWLEKQEKNKTRNYWKKYLEGYEEIAAVPKKKDAGIFAGGYNAAAASTRFEEEKTIALNKVAIRNHVTLNTVLQVAWGIVLGKYCSKQDIVYGVLISGRPPEIEGVESMIGCFINTIPVRITFDGKTKLNELIRNVQDRAIESEPHYYYSLAEIQAESALKQNLLDHIIEFQNYPPAERIEGVRDNIRKNKTTETLKLSNVNVREQSNYDFNIMIIPGNQVFLGFSYNANVYDSQLVAQLGLNSIRVLEQIIEDDKITIDEIAILSEEEKRKILFEFNNNTADFPRDKTIYRFVEKYAEMTADRIALVGKEEGGKGRKVEGKKDACAEAHLTYRELNERANRLAKVFRRRGIQKDEPVGILMHRSQAMVESILAAWKAGGAYMPIDPGYPGERIDHMLSDSRTKLLVTTRIFAREDRKPGNLKGKKAENRRKTTEDRKQWKVGSRKFNMIFLEDICNKTAVSPVAEHSPKAFKHCPKGSSSHLHLSPAPVTSLAYIIYTSGSTGKPKGVMIEHIGMMNHIQAKINDLQLTEKSIVAQNATHTFDISIWQFFSALITGGQTVIYPDELIMEPGKFLSRLKKDQITILEVVPSYLSVLLDDITEQHNMPLSLQYLLVTGEEIKPHLVKKWFDMYPNIKMVNAYGPTEASDDITHYIMDKAPDMERIPIGKPLQNMNIYIVDNRMHLCPIGVKGEICVAGVGVGRGYIGDEEKTKQVFIKNPFVSPITNESSSSSTNDRSPYYPNPPLPQSPIYLTGDLGAWLPDGTILFFGRKDYQVKIRGFRIELGEIEDRLLNHPEIKEAVVIDREDNTGNKYLCAYIVVQHTAQGPWRMEPGEFLSQTLPAYMIPAHFMRLENIPLTSSGKVDRKALPEPEGGQITQKYMAPTNPVEEKLAEIWSEVLGKEKGAIGIHHNFFDLGGHSLKAIVLVSKVHKEFNVKLPLAELFKTPTIKELSHYIKEAAKDRYASIESAEKKDYYVLSSAQQRLYIIQQMDLDSNAYNLPGVFPLPEKSDLKKIEETFIQLIKRHESLRTSFHMVDAKPVQRVHDFQDVEFKIEYYELTDNEGQNITDLVKGGSREEGKGGYFMASEHHLRRHFSSAFALSQPPLLKVGVVKTGQEKFLLVVVMHHIISDGISHTILVKDFTAIYNGKELPGLKLQYKDYAEWRLHPGQIEIIKKQENYWLKEFEKEIPVLNLPIDYERPEIQTIEGEMIDFVISKEETSALKHMASEDGATLHMILLALFNVFLSKVSDQEDIIIGTPAAGRRHADLDLIIGMFVNTLAFRNYPTREKTFKEFLKEVKERALQVFENQDFQFDDLVERVVRKRDINRNPIFDVMFMFQGRAEQNSSSPELENPEPYKYGAVWDLSLVGAERGENLSLTFGYRTTLFKTGTIKKFIKYFKEILSAVIEKKKIKLKDIKISHELFDKKLEIPREEGDFVF